MAYTQAGDALLLHRLVTHQGATAVQAVVLDMEHVLGPWLEGLIDDYGGDESIAVRALAPGAETACVVEAELSDVLPGTRLCVEALPAANGGLAGDLQRWVLFGLLVVVLLAVAVIHRAGRRAEELSAQKTAFVSAVSHELRTPLTTLRLHAEMLMEGLVGEARRDKVHAELVSESVRLSRLVENVLEISRLEEGRRVIHRARGDLLGFVREVGEQQRPFVEARDFELVLPSEADEAVECAFDRQALEQILVNLFDNALKYGAGETRRIEVRVEATEDGSGVQVEVRDLGPGIPEAERARVVERFYRVPGPEREHAPGTGLGLALVRELTVAHGGALSIDAASDGGARVRVVLPGS